MNCCSFSRAALTAFILTGLTTASYATALGLNNAPLGDTSSSTVGYAHWDTFTTVAFSNQVADTTDSNVFTATMGSTTTGGSTLGGAGIYTGVGAGSVPFALTITVTALVDFTTLSLQLKYTTPDVGTAADFFTISDTLPGVPSQIFVGTAAEGSGYNIYQWNFTGLDVKANDVFTLTITSPSAHVALDGARLDASVSAVPEPSTYAAIFGGVVLVGAIARRRFKSKSATV